MKLYPAPKINMKKKIIFIEVKGEWKTCDKNSQWKFYVNKIEKKKIYI